MAQTSNPYGFKLVYGKESQLSAGNQSFRIKDQYAVTSGSFANTLYPTVTVPVGAGIGSGDPVVLVPGTSTIGTDKVSTGTLGLSSDPWGGTKSAVSGLSLNTAITVLGGESLVGIFGGCSYQPKQQGRQLQRSEMYTNLTETASAAGALATVQDHPFLVWQVQTNGPFLASQVAAPLTPIGCNYNFTYNTGVNSSTGQSTAQLFVQNNLSSTAGAAYGLPQSAFANNAYSYFKVIGLAPIPNNNWTDPFVDVLVVINDHYLKAGTSSIGN